MGYTNGAELWKNKVCSRISLDEALNKVYEVKVSGSSGYCSFSKCLAGKRFKIVIVEDVDLGKMIKCPVCHREQPESLGSCDFCDELRMEWIREQVDGRKREMGEEDD